MTLDITKLNAVAETAKAKVSNNPRWIAAIDKAVAGIVSGWWIVTELADCVAITTETGKTYFANGSCQCRAYELGQPCKHRALARLVDLYNERETAPMAVSPSAEPDRVALIASIKATWPKACPGVHLADELMARFRKNSLEMLDTDMLRRVSLAVAL